MSKKINIYLILILAGFNLVLLKLSLFPVSRENSETPLSFPASKTEEENHCKNIINRIITVQLKNNGTILPEQLMIKSSDGTEHQLSSFRKHLPIIVADFRKASCSVCIEKEVELLRTIAAKIGKESIFLFIPFDSDRNRRAFESKYQLNTYQVDAPFDRLTSEIGMPCVFVLDNSLKMRDIHIVSSEDEGNTEIYYELIVEKHYN